MTARKSRGSWSWPLVVVVALLFIGGVWAVVARDDPKPGVLPAVDDPPPFSHIHGLGVNPADGLLYAATHGGLYRISDGEASIVANRYQDTMGFAVVGKNHFIGSGHPDFREDLPVLLGFLESRDAGKTWKKKSLLGEADFHALRAAHGTMWGYNSSSSTFMVSRDGKEWDTRSTIAMRDFVVSPDSSDVLFATNGEDLKRSSDGGRTWKRTDAPAVPLLASWESSDELWLLTLSGQVFLSGDSGKSWDQRGKLGGQPEAFVEADGTLYAATHDQIFVSKDEGRSWQVYYSEMAR